MAEGEDLDLPTSDADEEDLHESDHTVDEFCDLFVSVDTAAAAAELVFTPEPEHVEENYAVSAPFLAGVMLTTRSGRASRLPSRYSGRS